MAISALRQVTDSLESALASAQHGSARAPAFRASEPSEWDVVSQGDPAPAVSGNENFQSPRCLVPPHCLGLCDRLGPNKEERAQRTWEAGLWAKAVLEGRVSKPRPTEELNIRPTAYIVLRGPGVDQPVVTFSAAEYYKVLPRFTPSSFLVTLVPKQS